MSYAQRNNLTLLLILTIMLSGGFFWVRSQKSVLRKLRARTVQLKKRLEGDLEVSYHFTSFAGKRDSLQSVFENYPKKLVFDKEPAFSLRYINWLVKSHNLNIDFDFFLSSKTDKKHFMVYTYTLNGESDYPNFFSLVWNLVHYPILYQIKTVKLQRGGEESVLKFNIVLESYSMKKKFFDEPPYQPRLISTTSWRSDFKHDAFAVGLKKDVPRPAPKLIRKPVEPPEPPGLPDVTKSKLIALTQSQIYIRDQNGQLKSLRVGDRVHRGQLVRIDPMTNQALFRVRFGSTSRIVTLKLQYE